MDRDEQKFIQAYSRTITNGISLTFSWLMELNGMGVLKMEDLREFDAQRIKMNDKWRKKLAKKYKVAEYRDK